MAKSKAKSHKKDTSKKVNTKANLKVPRKMKEQIYNVTRDVESDLDFSRLDASGLGPLNLFYTNDGGVAGSYAFKLRMLPNYTEFSPLFKEYRILAVQTYLYPSSNCYTSGTGTNTQDNNLLIRLAPNHSGTAIAAGNTVEDWNQLQAKKRWIVRPDKQIKLYTKLNQRVEAFAETGGIVSTNYTTQKPKWVSTQSPNAIHFGHDIRFDSIDPALAMGIGNDFFPKFKVIQKVYLQLRGIK